MTQTKKVFLRDASGLVREVSTFKAFFFNLAAMSGGIVVLNYVYSAFYPAAPTFGLSSLDLAQILIAVPLILVAFIFVSLLAAMPRTGGDYVFTSRILHPFLGWLETWTLVWANLSIIGFELLQISTATSGFSTAMSAINKGSTFWGSLSSTLSVPVNQAVLGVILVALMGLLAVMGVRRFHSVVSTLAIIGVLGVLVQIVVVPFLSSSNFASNFQALTGNTTAQVYHTATTAPSSPLSLSPLTFAVLGPAIGFALFNLIGFQYSAYIGGELKGNVKRNGLISTFGSLWVYTLIVWVILVPVIFSKFGYNFLHAWAYLSFNAPSINPLGVVPVSPILELIARPDLWPLWFFIIISGDILMFALGPVYLFMMSRMAFSWSMDRMVPAWFGHVNERTHSPFRLYLLMLVGGLAFFLTSFPPLNFNLASLAYFSILLSALTWILPGFNVLLLSFRRKDIYEASPFKRKIAGVPVTAWLGIVWLAIILPIYFSAFFQPLFSAFISSPTWQYANSSGVLVTVILVIVGAAIYFAAMAYNRRRGVDVSLIFRTIPPE
jgi:basic amino acid/polyamine antiporter, APA family